MLYFYIYIYKYKLSLSPFPLGGELRNFGLSLSPVTKFQKKQKAFLLGILFFLQKSLAVSEFSCIFASVIELQTNKNMKKLKVFTLPIEEFYKKYPVEVSIRVPSIPKGHVAKIVSVRPLA